MKLLFENWRKFVFLTESKQDIINLGLPEIIASILVQRLGKHSYTVARWFKEYNSSRVRNYGKQWWEIAFAGFSGNTELVDLVELYEAAEAGPEAYEKKTQQMELEPREGAYHVYDKIALRRQIEELVFDNVFFSYKTLIKAIVSGELTDLAPYKKLDFDQAIQKYNEKKVFQDQEPLKVYEGGWRWINVGDKCELVGKLMQNCGSSGVMSPDPDRTMIALFDTNNVPHVVVTYSPNEKRISGDEGQASSKVKDKYHEYVLDLAEVLGAEFDEYRSKSKLLGLKYRLRGIADHIERISYGSTFDEYYKVVIGGKNYFGTNTDIVSQEDLVDIRKYVEGEAQKGTRESELSWVPEPQLSIPVGAILHAAFHYRNQDAIKRNVPSAEYVSTYKLAHDKKNA